MGASLTKNAEWGCRKTELQPVLTTHAAFQDFLAPTLSPVSYLIESICQKKKSTSPQNRQLDIEFVIANSKLTILRGSGPFKTKQ